MGEKVVVKRLGEGRAWGRSYTSALVFSDLRKSVEKMEASSDEGREFAMPPVRDVDGDLGGGSEVEDFDYKSTIPPEVELEQMRLP